MNRIEQNQYTPQINQEQNLNNAFVPPRESDCLECLSCVTLVDTFLGYVTSFFDYIASFFKAEPISTPDTMQTTTTSQPGLSSLLMQGAPQASASFKYSIELPEGLSDETKCTKLMEKLHVFCEKFSLNSEVTNELTTALSGKKIPSKVYLTVNYLTQEKKVSLQLENAQNVSGIDLLETTINKPHWDINFLDETLIVANSSSQEIAPNTLDTLGSIPSLLNQDVTLSFIDLKNATDLSESSLKETLKKSLSLAGETNPLEHEKVFLWIQDKNPASIRVERTMINNIAFSGGFHKALFNTTGKNSGIAITLHFNNYSAPKNAEKISNWEDIFYDSLNVVQGESKYGKMTLAKTF